MAVSHQKLEETILAHLRQRGASWVTSRELACEIGQPWRAVSRAMLRMPDLEKTEHRWICNRYRVRVCTAFRYVAPPTATYPSWLLGAVSYAH